MQRRSSSPTKKPSAKKKASARKTIAGDLSAAKEARSSARQRFDSLVAKLEAAQRDESRGWDSYFEIIGKILRDKLWLAAGFDSAQAWLASRVDAPMRTVWRSVRIAESSSPDEQDRYKRSKIDLALTLFDARDAADARKDDREHTPSTEPRVIDWDAQRFSVVRDGKKRSLTLEQITVVELQALIAALSPKRPKDKRTESELALRVALDEAGLTEVAIAQRDHVYSLSGLRADQFAALAKALTTATKR